MQRWRAEITDERFFNGKRVFITGNTGFLGSYLTLCLVDLGANVVGYSSGPPTNPNLYSYVEKHSINKHILADIRDYSVLQDSLRGARPEIVFHLAAQSIVRDSYVNPRNTFETNVIGSINLLEAVRTIGETGVVIVVTTDKVYKNHESPHPYREDDELGGSDPYSASKSCVDIAVSSYRESFLNEHGIALSSVRAGNLVGGGDWGAHRLIPDLVRSIISSKPITIRHPDSVRPWQFVLGLVQGMLILAERMWESPKDFSEAWNFGPLGPIVSVSELTALFLEKWGLPEYQIVTENEKEKESRHLQLDVSKARDKLGWKPKYTIQKTIAKTVEWYKTYYGREEDILSKTLQQMYDYGYEPFVRDGFDTTP